MTWKRRCDPYAQGTSLRGTAWIVTRLGADIGLECLTCKRRIMLTRRELLKKMKENLGREKKR
jgi:hypothetical protein